MTTATPRLGTAGQLYVATVAICGTGVLARSLTTLSTSSLGYQWFVLAGLTLLSGSFTIRIPTIPARLSVSETFVFTAAILFGPAAATAIVVLDTLIISLWLKKTSRRFSRVVFNLSAPAIAIWIASHIFFAVANIEPLYSAPRPILSLVVPLLLLALIYFLLNSWLIAIAVAFEKHSSAFHIWRDNFLWLSLNYFSGASVAALLLPYLQDEKSAFIKVASILLPLLLISYLTFKTALGRVEDANRHLSELNRLYLSTIETLAMAIDAKDQITHGHIRRVQQYAVGLAERIGIRDPQQIKAIEAASLLHDMGKLAIPEYILNKPGKLTPSEFEKMKLHASVGADILSAIEFPYPVVPIVRHHHENWDGTGYPDRLKGHDIPIGARILAVVDCFDALTSDRPYRPKLSDSDAVEILLQRSGSMYDPLIVDTFVAVHLDIAPSDTSVEGTQELTGITRDIRTAVPAVNDKRTVLDDIAAGTEEMVLLFDVVRNLTGQSTHRDVVDISVQHLRRVMPVTTCVLYAYEPIGDQLLASEATGEHSAHFLGLRIPRGQRLSGWVAANRQTIVNSDPVLDLSELARILHPRLKSCLATPLIHGSDLLGVLSIYSVQKEAFTEDHRRIVEVVARQVSLALKNSHSGDIPAVERELPRASGMPVHSPTGRDTDNATESAKGAGALSIALLKISVVAGERHQDRTEQAVDAIAEWVRAALRAPDILFRLSRAEIVVLLAKTGDDTATHIRRRISEQVLAARRLDGFRERFGVGVAIGIATAPVDGSDLDTLIAAARRSAKSVDDSTSDFRSVH